MAAADKSNKEFAFAFSQGDEKALSFFYHEFHPVLSLFAYKFVEDRMLAEEIASNAFVKIWKHYWKLNTYVAIRAYLYQTVRNECLDILRLRPKKIEPLKEATSLTTENTAFDNLVRSEVSRMIHFALQELSPGSRKVLTMLYLEGKTTREISNELQLSQNTVRTQKQRGLEQLRKILIRPITILSLLLIKIFFSFL